MSATVQSAEVRRFLLALRSGALDWEPRPAAAPADLERLRSALPGAPGTYLDLLVETDGGEGELQTAAPITCLRLWAAAASIDNNAGYEIPRWLPDHWGIGDNGGGEMLVFDRSLDQWPLYVVHATSMRTADRIPVAASFEELLGRIGKRTAPRARQH